RCKRPVSPLFRNHDIVGARHSYASCSGPIRLHRPRRINSLRASKPNTSGSIERPCRITSPRSISICSDLLAASRSKGICWASCSIACRLYHCSCVSAMAKKYIERVLIVLSGVSRNKTQDMLPRVCGNIGKLDGAPVKETMGSTRIDNDLMFNANLIQHLVKALHGADRNIGIGPPKQAKHRITDLVSLLQ